MPTIDRQSDQVNNQLGYKLFLPENVEQVSLPLILFLHGIKKRGDDLSVLEDYGLMRVAEQKPKFNYIVVAPQCPADTYWTSHRGSILKIIEEVCRQYPVDETRMYLTGFSMGGNGVWDLAARNPEVFGAVAPIAGWYEVSEAEKLTSMPIWAFHGEKDDVVPISNSEVMVAAIREIGGNPRFTRYPDLDHQHQVMYETYSNPELYDWFEFHKKC